MDRDRYRDVADRARLGDESARQELLAGHLPLVYNIVGRALNGHPDTDDVVQETMLHAVNGLPGLREPGAFRSWLVAIAMNQVRHRHRARQADRSAQASGPLDLDQASELADPAGDFVGLTIVRLGLSGQRHEVAEATRWLDEADREVLALWWQEAAGELSRPELAAALELSPQHTAVRVQRVKERLDAARSLVRALAARPGCPGLAELTAAWDGTPGALWRKRIARHVRDCAPCQGQARDLVPAEGLLAGLALLPLPRHLATQPVSASLPTGSHGAGGHRAGNRSGTRPAGRRAARLRARTRGRRRRLAVAALAVLATVAAAGLVWDGVRPAGDPAPRAGGAPTTQAESISEAIPGTAGVLVDAVAGGLPSVTPAPVPSTTPPSPSAPPSTAAPTPTPTPTAAPTPAPTPSRSSAAPRTPTSPNVAAYQQQVLDLVNSQRSQNGCGPLSSNAKLQLAAQRQSDDMAARQFFDHTNPDGAGPQQRIDAAGYQWSSWGENIARGQSDPASVMDSWMNSPGHRANILNCAFKEIGVGVHLGPGGPWWTQDFGSPS
ncbi:sigma-70 family RNA polymerase sigma factor [Kitasatospora azatica]|uniref:sigma-70 family RNA polymerase sigma factor n=1 Tax=Kitasatospora azatica TaxID=58347 RepID=UPI00068EE832|nr:sigma-70 family RNA polymerase sigma factor [Kitasatospora azatica]